MGPPLLNKQEKRQFHVVITYELSSTMAKAPGIKKGKNTLSFAEKKKMLENTGQPCKHLKEGTNVQLSLQ